MSYTDYIGRTVDVSAFQGPRIRGVPLDMQLAIADGGGSLVTGILKLAQRFMIMLMTEQGSVKHLPDYGTEFMALARQGYLRTEIDVRAAFAEALVDIKEQLRLVETTADPDDERFETAELIAVEVIPGYASIRFSLTSLAGTARQVILPLDTPI